MKIIVYDESQLLASPYVDTLISYLKRLRNVDHIDIKNYVKETKHATYFLAVNDSMLMGMARYSQLTQKLARNMHVSLSKYSKYKIVSSVYVDDKYRKMGVGKRILKKMRTMCDKMILDTYISWTPAMKLYLSAGFKILDTYKWHGEYLAVFIIH